MDVAKTLSEYLGNMKRCRQFTYIDIEPVWVPGTGDIDGFIQDEVVRQLHDPRVESDGGVRIKWMRAAWDYAINRSQGGIRPDYDDVLGLAATIEPEMNTNGFRLMNVYIGGSMGAPPERVPMLMAELFTRVQDVVPEQGRRGPHPDEYRADWSKFRDLVQGVETADDFYLAFEAIHPFGDGNGRTGKVLNNWLLGTLEEPVLVADYFGLGNP